MLTTALMLNLKGEVTGMRSFCAIASIALDSMASSFTEYWNKSILYHDPASLSTVLVADQGTTSTNKVTLISFQGVKIPSSDIAQDIIQTATNVDIDVTGVDSMHDCNGSIR